jgi:hypothetical protein
MDSSQTNTSAVPVATVEVDELGRRVRQLGDGTALTELAGGGQSGGVDGTPQVADLDKEDAGIDRQADEGGQSNESQGDQDQRLAALAPAGGTARLREWALVRHWGLASCCRRRV